MREREWLPIPGTARARLASAALGAFGERGYDGVAVTDLARAAGVTTGALYHHFDGKQGLYAVVRLEAERRALDRMEGAAAAGADLMSAMLVGFDYVADAGLARLLGEPPRGRDPITQFAARTASPPLARIVTAAWRAALTDAANDIPLPEIRAALAALRVAPTGA